MFCIHTRMNKVKTLLSGACKAKIIAFSEEMTYLRGRGCLPSMRISPVVPRAKRIKVRAHVVDLETGISTQAMLKFSGFVSIIVQHEYDHLLGILFIDKIKPGLPTLNPIVFKNETTERTV